MPFSIDQIARFYYYHARKRCSLNLISILKIFQNSVDYYFDVNFFKILKCCSGWPQTNSILFLSNALVGL